MKTTKKYIILGFIVISIIISLIISSYPKCTECKCPSVREIESKTTSTNSELDLVEPTKEVGKIEIKSHSETSDHIVGEVINNTKHIVKFVTVDVTFYDEDGVVSGTSNTFAVGSEGLEPGKTSSFKLYTDDGGNYSTYKLDVIWD